MTRFNESIGVHGAGHLTVTDRPGFGIRRNDQLVRRLAQ